MITNLTIKVDIDSELKEDIENILSQIGLNTTEAFKIFLEKIIEGNNNKQVNKENLVFSESISDYTITNQNTLRVINDAEKGNNIKSFNSIDDLYKDLGFDIINK